ncbi:50S ribosomal protein L21, mitochondrial-like [Iris pallida]|uniref:50S ribosomal protein L21, mitochondrial-like n=1 Tax=Iris pallida TaxID=29817 RepID=A0AAX6F2B1_IRIPA|nr:50S ribosomal protein L21, mitochondrial-like [Iris pallida]
MATQRRIGTLALHFRPLLSSTHSLDRSKTLTLQILDLPGLRNPNPDSRSLHLQRNLSVDRFGPVSNRRFSSSGEDDDEDDVDEEVDEEDDDDDDGESCNGRSRSIESAGSRRRRRSRRRPTSATEWSGRWILRRSLSSVGAGVRCCPGRERLLFFFFGSRVDKFRVWGLVDVICVVWFGRLVRISSRSATGTPSLRKG